MARVLIFNGTPLAAEERLMAFGSPSYEALIKSSLDAHVPAGRAIDYHVLRVADGERLPQGMHLGDFDGVWISGSPLNVYALAQPSVPEQLDFVREIWAAGIPAFGSCWGLQLMVAALGGTVHLNPRGREVGIARRIQPNDAGRAHPLLEGKGVAFDALCTHEDEVAALPSCGTVLASNAVSRVQAAEMREGERCFWGVQYHPEFGFETIAAIIAMRIERHIQEGLARDADDVAQIIADFRGMGSDPPRTDLVWKYGLDAAVTDPLLRTREFGNWLRAGVFPSAAAR